ncbi:BA75_03302T0 [Komagataella pastoris]|uniref:BA75_03302T0 n=1 Tax=Komagataella pastoris TaxID=4922 RepID=A0A1B2JAW3_PICPA|nr:BA75_03302T0 [Komagataella pastoris]
MDQDDLFPNGGNPSSSSLPDSTSLRSVDTELVQEVLEATDPVDLNHVDKFYFTNLFGRHMKQDQREFASDFEKFNKETLMEERLRSKVSKVLSSQQKSNHRLRVVGSSDAWDQKSDSNSFKTIPLNETEWNENVPIDLEKNFETIQDDVSSVEKGFIPVSKRNFVSEWYHKPKRYDIQRKLKTRNLLNIALGGTIGVGILLSSGKGFSIAGPLGCLIGFMITGMVVLATMLSFCEMVTLLPLCGGVSGVASRFVDDAFGFALGIGYWFSYTIGLPTEIIAATIMLSYYEHLNVPGPSTSGWVIFFILVIVSINLCDVRVYGEVEYFSTIIKVLALLVLIIFMVVLNAGGVAPSHEYIGFRYWDSSKTNRTEFISNGPFRPTFDLADKGLGSFNGIGGNVGRFCSVLVACVLAAYSYVGTEIVLIAGGESQNPRKAIPAATKVIYWRIIFFYMVAIFVIGLNINSGDPRLLRFYTDGGAPTDSQEQQDIQSVMDRNNGNNCHFTLLKWGGFTNGNQSPWIIALQSAGLCSFAAVLNAFLIYFALTAGSSQLYASSRTLYYLSIQGKVPKFFGICSKRGVPYISVLFTGSFSTLAFFAVRQNTVVVFSRYLSICASAGLIVWTGMCLSFIRFYYGLQLRPDIITRNDDNYPYRSPFQPYLAYFGFCMGSILVLSSGFVVFLNGHWSTTFFFTSYGSLILLFICYFGYKILRRTSIQRLDQLDLDSGRREIDRIIWEEEKDYTVTVKGWIRFIIKKFVY